MKKRIEVLPMLVEDFNELVGRNVMRYPEVQTASSLYGTSKRLGDELTRLLARVLT